MSFIRRLVSVGAVCAAALALPVVASASTYGPYHVHPVTSTFCMDVRGGEGATANGTLVQQWPCWNGKNQQWDIQDVGNSGGFYLAPRNAPGKCLNVRGGSNAGIGAALQIWDCYGYPNGVANETFYMNRLSFSINNYTPIRPWSALSSTGCVKVTGAAGFTSGATLGIGVCDLPQTKFQWYLSRVPIS